MPNPMRGGLSTPVSHIAANPCQIVSGTATTIGSVVMLEDPNRRRGVYVQATSIASGRILVGTTSSDAQLILETLGATGNGPNNVFVPGTGSIFIRGATTNADYVAMAY